MADKAIAKVDKSGKKDDKKKSSGVSGWLRKTIKSAVIASLVFICLVFILGEAFAFYAMRTGNAYIIWLPVFILIAILFYKVLD